MSTHYFTEQGENDFPATLRLMDGVAGVMCAPEYDQKLDRWLYLMEYVITNKARRAVVAELNKKAEREANPPRKFIAGFEPGVLCSYCLKPCEVPVREHIVPFSKGGTESYDNIIPACKPCNSRKKDMSLLEFVQRGGLWGAS